jgi:hypothetical protein
LPMKPAVPVMRIFMGGGFCVRRAWGHVVGAGTLL